jgi:hypothetical protein
MAAPDCKTAAQRRPLAKSEERAFMASAGMAALGIRGVKVMGVRVMGVRVMGVTHVS